MCTVGDGIISEIRPCKGRLPHEVLRDAAPEMLKALELIQNKIWQHVEMNMTDEDVKTISAAIKKAKGMI